jgi:adenine-specific DNA-methyltransferase
MLEGKKRKDLNSDIKSYLPEKSTRKNAVPIELASYDTSKPKLKKYEYDPHLDPQLIWADIAEHTFFKVTTVFICIYKRITPEAIIMSFNGDNLTES